MTFPNEIAEKVLVDCKRSCAICHKFCGTRIEIHHIKPVSEGGAGSYENSIPLCFDCHSDVKAYNEKHPKGKKYTESELIRHRTNWYDIVKSGQENVELELPPQVNDPAFREGLRQLFVTTHGRAPSCKEIDHLCAKSVIKTGTERITFEEFEAFIKESDEQQD